jgi:beta-lactamase regulating signal transducer with metallopeptidase domain
MYWVGLSVFIHSAIILAAANILGRIPRKLSPAHRHQIILAGFVLMMIWPLFSAVMPQIELPLWPYGLARDSVTVQQTILILRPHATTPHTFNWPGAIWITGMLLALTPITLGYLNVLRMAQRARRLNDDASEHLLTELCSELSTRKIPALLIAPESLMPLAFGMRRPRILLPVDYTEWTPLRQRAVLLHELAHVRRRDILAQLFANVITAIWWFQPLCWINCQSLRRESERACDALVLASGVRPSDYATQLLEIAHAFSKGQRWSSAAITMARRGELEARMLAILVRTRTAEHRSDPSLQ